jgi:hypothetical protein
MDKQGMSIAHGAGQRRAWAVGASITAGAVIGAVRGHFTCAQEHHGGRAGWEERRDRRARRTKARVRTERGTEERLGEWVPESWLVRPGALSEDISPALKDITAVGLLGGQKGDGWGTSMNAQVAQRGGHRG